MFAFKRDLRVLLSCRIIQVTGTILFLRDKPIRNFVMSLIRYVSFWTFWKYFLHSVHGFISSYLSLPATVRLSKAEAISSDIVPNLFSNICNVSAVLYVRDEVPQLSNHTCTRT